MDKVERDYSYLFDEFDEDRIAKQCDWLNNNMKELDELRAIKGLFSELEKGELSARRDGWIFMEDVEKRLQ